MEKSWKKLKVYLIISLWLKLKLDFFCIQQVDHSNDTLNFEIHLLKILYHWWINCAIVHIHDLCVIAFWLAFCALCIFYIVDHYQVECSKFANGAKLYIPSTLNTDYLLWHTQLIVVCSKILNHGLNPGFSSCMTWIVLTLNFF